MPPDIRKILQPAHEKRFVFRSPIRAATLLLITTIFLNTGCKPPATPATTPPPTTVANVEPETPATAPTLFTNSLGMSFAPVPPGEFIMGSPPTEPGHDPDETQHEVHITKPFFLGIYPVTQKQYAALIGTNPGYFRGEDFPPESRGDLPVESISWFDAVAFCKKLSEKEGRTYRLPTEAQREYACRAGTTTPYAGKLDDIGWYLGNSSDKTHPVGLLLPNDWGFYDMQGNVWEWCADWYGPYPSAEATDPTGPTTGTTRVLRGGSMGYDPQYARSAFRNYYLPDTRVYHNGFRVALDSP